MITKSVGGLLKGESAVPFKTASVEFSLFKEDYLVFEKNVDRPNEYYFPGDEITYIIKIKNVGNKDVKNLAIKEEIPLNIGKINNQFVMQGLDLIKTEEDNLVKISNINIKPNQEIVIKITGIVV